MNSRERILGIKEVDFSWKERDILTAAERFMTGAIDLSLVEFISPCFPGLDNSIVQKLTYVWRFTSASHYLQIDLKENDTNSIQGKASRIYQLEAQRILGSFFASESAFWDIFYSRQGLNQTIPLVVIDALYYGGHPSNHISYQLLLQGLKSIIKGYYGSDRFLKKEHLENLST